MLNATYEAISVIPSTVSLHIPELPHHLQIKGTALLPCSTEYPSS
jgi:hypothetical protein